MTPGSENEVRNSIDTTNEYKTMHITGTKRPYGFNYLIFRHKNNAHLVLFDQCETIKG
jgi:hypothetical protein